MIQLLGLAKVSVITSDIDNISPFLQDQGGIYG